MTKAPVPTRLSRGATRRAFPKVGEATWDNLFDNERNNGLHKCRVDGPDTHSAYYSVEQVMHWLMERNLYRRSDFYERGELLFDGIPILKSAIRTHLIAG